MFAVFKGLFKVVGHSVSVCKLSDDFINVLYAPSRFSNVIRNPTSVEE